MSVRRYLEAAVHLSHFESPDSSLIERSPISNSLILNYLKFPSLKNALKPVR